MSTATEETVNAARGMERGAALRLRKGAGLRRRLAALVGRGLLFSVACMSTVAVLFIFAFVIRDALPFFRMRGFAEFFTSTRWYPSASPAEFGTLAIFVGSGLVTLGAIVFAVPVGIAAAVCLSDILPFGLRQFIKPVIEVLASIPSVAYGFFALVVFAPFLQNHGGGLLHAAVWMALLPAAVAVSLALTGLLGRFLPVVKRPRAQAIAVLATLATLLPPIYLLASAAGKVQVASGTNALNVSLILAVMVLPTVVSVSEDALQSVGREIREASYACGATRAETIMKVVIPAASSGICSAVILGLMRAIGETMVVWMASGNAARIPEPWFNVLEPVRTLTATIAGDMGEADHVTGSERYHVLFAMALCLLAVSFLCNLASEWVIRRQRRKLIGA